MVSSERKLEHDKLTIIARHAVFQGLSQEQLARLSGHARVTSYAEGQPIFAKGEVGHAIFITLAGAVKISVPSDEGKEIALNLIRPGEIFGEIALLDGQERTANAHALLDSTVLSIDRRDFLQVLGEEPAIGLKLLRIVSERLRRTSEQVEDISFVDWPARLAKAILRLAEVQGVLAHDKPRVRITQKELGQTIGLSRESTNRQLREWAAFGVISLEKGGFRINRADELSRVAGGS